MNRGPIINGKTIICVVLLIVTITGPGCISKPESPQQNITHDNSTEDIKNIEGLWQGSLKVPGGAELRILVTIQPPPNQLANIDFDVIGTSDY